MNKKTIAMIGIIAAVIVFTFIAVSKNNIELVPEQIESVLSGSGENDESTAGVVDTKPTVAQPGTQTVGTPTKPSTTGLKSFTLAQVATHNSEADCYSAINGNVYDLTAFINKHPGGDRNILRICGLDGSSLFNGQHGGDAKPERILAGFEIGTLVQ